MAKQNKTFEIKVVSQTNSVISTIIFLGIIIPLGLLRNTYLPIPYESKFTYLFSTLFVILFYFLFQKIATARIQWIFSDTKIVVHFKTQFAFSKQEDIIIKHEEIESCSSSTDPMYETLKIKLVSGQVLKFYHSNIKFRDDYSSLVSSIKTLKDLKSKAK